MDYYNNGNYGNNYNPYHYQYNNQNDEAYIRYMHTMQAKAERKQIRTLGNIVGLTMCLYLICQTAVSFLLLLSSDIYELYCSSATFYYSFTIIGVSLFCVAVPFGVMALANKNKYESRLVPSKKISGKMLCLWTGFGMLCCIAADYIVSIISYLFSLFGYQLTSSSSPEVDSLFSCVLCIVATVFAPAICEEFAMRCCAVGLLKKYGKAFAVVSVSVLFGVLHGNLVQFIFATIVGLILGYVTVKTDNILPAVIIHALNNSMSALSSVFEYAAGDSDGVIATLSDNSTSIFFIFWLVFGIIATAALYFKGGFKRQKKEMLQPYENSVGKKLFTFFFTPAMLIPFLFFIYECVLTVSQT